MPSNAIRTIIILGVIAIAGILFIQGYWVSKTLNLKEEEFHLTVISSLREVAESIAKYNKTELPKTNLISRRYSNYYSVNVNSRIDANILEDFLFQEFEKRSLNTVFEYAVYDCQNDSLVYGNYCNISEDSQAFVRSEDLPKFDDLVYYFVVKFPARGSYIVGTMRQSIAFSILALLSVIFFAYAMWVILRQKQLTELQKDFINNMTHEFKTPISSIKIASDVIAADPLIDSNERLKKYTSIIKQQNVRLNDQVEKVLNIARLEKDQFKLNKVKLNITQVIENIINNSQLKFEEKNGRIFLKSDSRDIIIKADELHFINVINTIIDNSFKYCNGKPEVKISIKDKDVNQIRLSIKDNGIGIAKEDQKKIFEKFFRVSTGNIHNVKGFGLGLFYVKNICESHHWHFYIESKLGQGTTFNLIINKV